MSRYVGTVFGEGPDGVPEDRLSLYPWEDGRPGEEIEASEIGAGRGWVAFVVRRMQPLAWHGHTVYPSLLDPRGGGLSGKHLRSSIRSIRARAGRVVGGRSGRVHRRAAPAGRGGRPWSPGLHITPYLLGQFRQRKGYDLRAHLASIFFDVGDYRTVRFDLYDLMHELWVENNWALPMEGWCEGRDVALTATTWSTKE